MLKIGDFSKLAHVTIKTLHHYARLGLLQPVWTDRYSGYRYYALEQLPRLNRIHALKDLGFSLEQISAMLDANLSSEVLQQMFNQKQDELLSRVTAEEGKLKRVAERLKQIEQEGRLPAVDMTVKPMPSQWIISHRIRLTDIEELDAETQSVRQQLGAQAIKVGLRSAHSWLVLHNAAQFMEGGTEVDVGLLLTDTISPSKRYAKLNLVHLPPVPIMASMLIQRGEHMVTESFTDLYSWAERNGYLIVGPPRQVVFEQANEKSNYTELQVPVESAIERKRKYLAITSRKEKDMEPKFITRPAFTLVGMRYFGNNQNQEISKLWGAANQHLGKVKNVAPEWGAIGLCTTVADAPPGEFEYVAGLVVNKVEDLPEGFVIREVPEHKYAVFTHEGSLATLKDTYEYIYQTWLPQSSYKLAGNIDFEYYDEDFKDFAPDSRFYIYVPIK